MVRSPTIEELQERARAQVERYRNQGVDLDGFEFVPLEEGRIFHVDNPENLADREQAWLQRNDAGEWDVVFLDYESAQNVYQQHAQGILERERSGNANRPPDTLQWVANRTGRDDREPPEIEPFWILNNGGGNTAMFRHEHFHLVGPDGLVIEPQNNMYPPHLLDLQSGWVAAGYNLQLADPDNLPENLDPGLIGENGFVDPSRMGVQIGWMAPDPSNPENNIRFHPAQEGFAIAYAPSREYESVLQMAALIGSSASFYIESPDRNREIAEGLDWERRDFYDDDLDGTVIINMPEGAIPRVSVEPVVQVAPAAPDYSRVNEAFASPEPEPVQPAQEASEPEPFNYAFSVGDSDNPTRPAGPVENDIEAPEQTPATGIVSAASSSGRTIADQLNAYLDIVNPPEAEALRDLLEGEFGEPTVTDLAFVAESIYGQLIENSTDIKTFRAEGPLVFENLQTELGQLRELAGYDAQRMQSDSYTFIGAVPRIEAFENPVITPTDQMLYRYEFDLPPGILGSIPPATLTGMMLNNTSFMNDPEFAAGLEIRILEASDVEVSFQEREEPGVARAQAQPIPDQSVLHGGEAQFDKAQYYEFSNNLVGDILQREGGINSIVAGFMEMNDPEIFPYTPLIEEGGLGVVTMNLDGKVYSLWNDEDGSRVMLSAEDLGAIIDRAVNIEETDMQSFLAANPDMEVVFQMMAVSLHEIEAIEAGNLNADVNPDGTSIREMTGEEFDQTILPYITPGH